MVKPQNALLHSYRQCNSNVGRLCCLVKVTSCVLEEVQYHM